MYFKQEEINKVTSYPGGTTNDPSLLYRYWISPMCAKLVAHLPSYVAPNLLTLSGWICTVSTFLLSWYFMPTMTEETHRWVYLLMGTLIFTYMILDNMDGKQAFRTGSSTPLGEALDHGVDSFSVGIMLVATSGIVQNGIWWPLFCLGPAMVAFYLAHWQEYFNHYLDLGLLGPTEAETLSAFAFWATGIFGPQIWRFQVNIFGLHFTTGSLVMLATFIAALWTISFSLWDGLTLAKKKGVNRVEALTQLFPFTLSLICGAAWVISNPYLYQKHPQMMVATFNLLFSYLTILCIIQRVCSLTYSYFYLPMIPMILAAVHSVLHLQILDEQLVLRLLFWFYLIQFALFAREAVTRFCKALNINFLSIAYPNKATKSS